MTCATFATGATRGNAGLETRSMIALDIEANPRTGELPVSFDAAVAMLSARRIRGICWTTHSHVVDAPRYRILMPLSAPIAYDPEIDTHLTAACGAQLGMFGVCDPSKFGAASLFYLPRHKEDAPYQVQEITGSPINTGLLVTMATVIAQGVAQDMAAVAARRAANALPPEITAKIQAYNEAGSITDSLIRYGYTRDGGSRFRSRYQHGIGATTILPDQKTWVSFSESDAAAGVGQRPARPSSQCAAFGDRFSLFCHYEHGGNFRRALEALGDA